MDRTVDGFFYGLFMDPDVLADIGITCRNPRPAYADNFELVIGSRATLWPREGARAYGMIYSMTHAELHKLYSGAGLQSYRAEALLAVLLDSSTQTACLCYNLPVRPTVEDINRDYSQKLKLALERFGFPDKYISSIATK